MGAETFVNIQRGATAKAAFDDAVADAQHDYGHAGYTGTIAEMDDFFMVPLRGLHRTAEESVQQHHKRVEKLAYDLMDDEERLSRYGELSKWSPCACMDIGGGEFLFFGWASS